MSETTDEITTWALSTATGLGYDTMEHVRRHGWQPVASWGRDGWDLGEWPYVVIYHRDADTFGLGYYVEGDVTRTDYATRAERDAATDELALFHWQHNDAKWAAGIRDRAHAELARPWLLGPYSPNRVDREPGPDDVRLWDGLDCAEPGCSFSPVTRS